MRFLGDEGLGWRGNFGNEGGRGDFGDGWRGRR